MHHLATQWIRQGYAIFQNTEPVSHEEYQRLKREAPLPSHYYFDHCEATNQPRITATYESGAAHAFIEVDFITAQGLRLTPEGLTQLLALLTPYATRGKRYVSGARRYVSANFIPRDSLEALMPQICDVVRIHTEVEIS